MTKLFDLLPLAAIVQLAHVLSHRGDQILRRNCQINLSQFKVLLIINGQTEPISQTKLATCMFLTPAAISQLVTTLSNLGYVTQVTTPKNRRQNQLTLTSRGKTVMEAGLAHLVKIEAEVQKKISTEEYRNCLATVQQLLQALQ